MKLEHICRFLTLIVYLCCTIPLLYCCLPLRLLHSLCLQYHWQRHFLPFDYVIKYWDRGILWICGVTIHFEGIEQLNLQQPTIVMSSHASNLDPFIISSGPLALKYVGKQELFRIPIIGWLMYLSGHVPLDRKNRTKAIESLKRVGDQLRTSGDSLAVFPEGILSV